MDGIQAYLDSGNWGGLAEYAWSPLRNSLGLPDWFYWWVALAWVFAFIVIFIRIWNGSRPFVPITPDLEPVSQKGYRQRGKIRIPLELGNVLLDLQHNPYETVHVAIGGRSRLGKSSTVLPLLDLPMGVLVIALDNTRPITNRIRELEDGIEWTNEPDWPVGIDLLAGPARTVSEVLVEGWAAKTAGDTGKWRRIARDRLWRAMDEMDRQGIVRNIPDLARSLWEKTGDGEVDRACRDWASRLTIFVKTMGTSLADGYGESIDIAQCMKEKKKVVLRVNQYLNPLDAPMLSGMLLVHARRAAQEVGEPFIIIVEEAGQMSRYQDEIIPLAQAAADRQVVLIVLTQNLSRLPLEVANNIGVWISYSQEHRRELVYAASALRLKAEHLFLENFPGKYEQQGRGWCYVRAPGLQTRLVNIKLKKPKAVKTVKYAPRPMAPNEDIDFQYEYSVVANQLDGWQPGPLALGDGTVPVVVPEIYEQTEDEPVPSWVGTDRDMLRMWNQCERTGQPTILWSAKRGGVWYDERGCLEWQGGYTKKKAGGASPRPRSTMNGQDITPYIEFYRRAIGDPRPTLDHNCDYPACCDPDHLTPSQIGDNTANNEPRRLAFELAGYEKIEAFRYDKKGEVIELYRWAKRIYA